MAGVQHVEAAVRERNLLPEPSPALEFMTKGFSGQDFFLAASRSRTGSEQIAENLVSGDRGDADFFNSQTAGDVGKSNGGVIIRARRQRHPQDAQHHVPRAGDVIDLSWTSRK